VRGTGMKASDHNAVPLCPQHHRALHDHGGEKEWFKLTKGEAAYGKRIAMRLWYRSPAYKDETK